MRDNILIHNFPYTQNENLAATMPETIKQSLGVYVEFAIIHRNGIQGVHNGKPVTITAKLADRTKKEEILNAQKAKKNCETEAPFLYHTPTAASRREEQKQNL
jgi:pseudouridine-5'-phosphate glycosidase